MVLRIVAASYGAWLFLINLVFYLAHGNDLNSLQYAVMLGCIPAALQFMLVGFDQRGISTPLKFSLALLVIVLLSYLANPGYIVDWLPVIQTVNVIFLLSVAMLAAGCPERRLVLEIAAAYAVFTSIFLIPINLNGLYIWGRLSAGMEPNYWGLIGVSVSVAALGFRNPLFAGPCFLIGCWTMYDASSRSSMVGLAAAIIVLLCRGALELRGWRLYAALSAVAGILIALILTWHSANTGATNIVAGDVLKLNDPYRGLDSGFTGRTEVWSDALKLWINHPLFGVGFRMHEQILDFPAHNAYLAMAADTGIFGLLLYCALLVRSFAAGWRLQDPIARRLIIATVVSYAEVGLFERRAINVGNPMGIIFVMACFLAFTFAARRLPRRQEELAKDHGFPPDPVAPQPSISR